MAGMMPLQNGAIAAGRSQPDDRSTVALIGRCLNVWTAVVYQVPPAANHPEGHWSIKSGPYCTVGDSQLRF